MNIPHDYERILPPVITPDMSRTDTLTQDANCAIGRMLFHAKLDRANDAAALRKMARDLFNAAWAADKKLSEKANKPHELREAA